MNIGIMTDVIDSAKYRKGVYYYTKNTIKNIMEIGPSHDFYLVHHHKNENDDIYNLGLEEVVIKPYFSKKSFITKYLTNTIRAPKILNQLDIIHIPQSSLSYIPIYSIPSLKKILTVHGTDLYIPSFMRTKVYKRPRVWFHHKLMDLTIPKIKDKIDKYIVVSYFLKGELIKLKIPEEKISVIYEGVDGKFRPEKIQKPDNIILSDAPTLELFKVYYKLKKKGIKHKLFIAGVREYTSKGEEIASNLGLAKDVFFLGHLSQEELIKQYNMADIFVHLTGYEGFGLQPLEAMACGCPVVTTNVGSLPEVVGDAGILKNQDDIEGIVKAVHEVLTNEGLREELIKRGIERAKMFSWEKTAKETIKVYEEVCDANS